MKIIFLLIVISVISCYGQESVRSSKDSLNSVSALDVTFLNEQSLSFRYRFSDRFSWKVGADLSANFSDGKSIGSETKSTRNEKSLGIRLNNQIYLTVIQNDFLSFHYDVGPSLYYWRGSQSAHYDYMNQTSEYSETIFEYGLINSLGVDMTVSKTIFLVIKYDYLLTRGSSIRKSTFRNSASDGETNQKRYYFYMKLSTIKIGVGINL